MLNGFKIKTGANIQPKTGTTVTTQGDIAYNSSSNQFEIFSTAAEAVTTTTNTQSFTNKTINITTNTLNGFTVGDIIYGNSSGVGARLAIGSVGSVLTVGSSNTLAWQVFNFANQTLSNLTGPTSINQDLTFANTTSRNITVATPAANINGKNLTISSGSSGSGTDKSPGILTLASGTSTGQDISSAINFQLPTSGVSGTTVNSLFTAATIQIEGVESSGSDTYPSFTLFDSSNRKSITLYTNNDGNASGLAVNNGNTDPFSITVVNEASGTDAPGGAIQLISSNSTGNAGSEIQFYTSVPGSSGSSTNAVDLTASIGGSNNGLNLFVPGTNNAVTIAAPASITPYTIKLPSAQGANTNTLVNDGSGNLSWGIGGTTSPLTTKGDLYGFSGTNARIPVGSNGSYLVADSTQTLGVKWSASGTSSLNVPIVTDWVAYTPAFGAGYGTPTSVTFFWRRVGDSVQISGRATCGTTSAASSSISIPIALTIDTTKTNGGVNYLAGHATANLSSASSAPNLTTLIISSTSTVSYSNVGDGSSPNNLGTVPVSTVLGNGLSFSVLFQVPIVGWSANNTVNVIGTAAVAPTIQTFTSGSGTYTLPSSPRSPLYIRVRAIGGGGGGGGSGSVGGSSGGTGGVTTFGTSLLTANGGVGGQSGALGNNGGAGGTASLGSGPIGTVLTGGSGSPGNAAVTINSSGGSGASSPFGGQGGGGPEGTNTGVSGANNTGAGGGGAGVPTSGANAGAGGGAGGYIDALITSSIASTYAYTVGTAGAAGTGGTNGTTGGLGGSGYIEVTEYYQ